LAKWWTWTFHLKFWFFLSLLRLTLPAAAGTLGSEIIGISFASARHAKKNTTATLNAQIERRMLSSPLPDSKLCALRRKHGLVYSRRKSCRSLEPAPTPVLYSRTGLSSVGQIVPFIRTNAAMWFVTDAPNLMQRLSRLPPRPTVTLLDRRKFSLSWPHANTTFTQQTYIRWCCIDLSNARMHQDLWKAPMVDTCLVSFSGESGWIHRSFLLNEGYKAGTNIV